MQSILRFRTITFGLMLFASQPRADSLVSEEQLLLPIQVDSHIEKIEALIVRPVKEGKYPIALIVNGSAATSPSAAHADWLAHIAHDFAHRGWLAASIVWPGYGRSTGNFMNEGELAPIPTWHDFSMRMAESLAPHWRLCVSVQM